MTAADVRRESPAAEWGTLDVMMAARVGSATRLSLTTLADSLPPEAGALQRIADEQTASRAENTPGWQADEMETHARPDGTELLTRRVRWLEDGQDVAGLLAWWLDPSGLKVAVAQRPADSPDDLLDSLLEVVDATGPAFLLSGEEVVALAGTAGLSPPEIELQTLGPDTPAEVRDLVLQTARGSLRARGLLEDAADGVRMHPALESCLRTLLDGDLALLLSSASRTGTVTGLLGGSGGRLAQLEPAGPGIYLLHGVSPASAHQQHARALGLQDAAPASGEPRSCTVARLRGAVDGTGKGPDEDGGAADDPVLAEVKLLVTLRGLRRDGPEVSVLDVVWVDCAGAGLWRVLPEHDDVVRLEPWSGEDALRELAAAVGFSDR